jgi:4-carboxymuconolactone decarboxylase
MDETERYDSGLHKRRSILGDAHVDRSLAGRNDFNGEFQDLITRYAWGEIWTRPGLDDRTRRLLVLATTIALGRWEEFRLHVRAAAEAGVPQETIKEVILQQAIYAGVPAANTAFHHAAEIFAALGKG